MFGFIVPNTEKLDIEQKEHFRSVYCGLCSSLKETGGFSARMTLTFELAFLIIVLSDVYGEGYVKQTEKCPVRLKRKITEKNRFSGYAADINLILAYYKLLDDKNDDRSPSAAAAAAMLKRNAFKAAERQPDAAEAIKSGLEALNEAEKRCETLPDVPAGIFGDIMGAIFAYGGGEYDSRLHDFGCSLGKAVYMMDAVVDLKKDIAKRRYNPLVFSPPGTGGLLLDVLLDGTVKKYRELPFGNDRALIENVLLSGIWTAYENKMKRGKN